MTSQKLKRLLKYIFLGMIISPALAFMATYIIGILTRPEGMTVSNALDLINESTLTLQIGNSTFLGQAPIWIIIGGVLGAISYIVLSLKKTKCNPAQ